VAISRVKNIEGLHFIDFLETKITTSKATIQEVERMQKNMLFDTSPILNSLPDLRINISVSHINAQSFNCHLQEIKHHCISQSSHVLCITETFLIPMDNNDKPYRAEYSLFRKDRIQISLLLQIEDNTRLMEEL